MNIRFGSRGFRYDALATFDGFLQEIGARYVVGVQVCIQRVLQVQVELPYDLKITIYLKSGTTLRIENFQSSA